MQCFYYKLSKNRKGWFICSYAYTLYLGFKKSQLQYQKTCRILNVSRLSRSLKAYIFSFGSLDQSVGCIYENKLGILNTELFYDICPRYIVNQKSSVPTVKRIQKLETAGTNPKVLHFRAFNLKRKKLSNQITASILCLFCNPFIAGSFT